MIENYLSASRRTKPTSKDILEHYKQYYRLLGLQLPLGSALPELTVVYSADRRCELVNISERSRYLVYDQYLGQSFNKLNRNQFARHSKDQLAKSYGCKYLAEKLLLKDETVLATVLALLSVGFNSHVQENGDPYTEISSEDERRRLDYIVTQELYVIAHEIGHFVFLANADADKKPEEHIRESLLEFAARSKLDEDSYDRIAQRYGKKAADEARDQDNEALHKETIDKYPELISEAFADQIGALMTFRVATEFFEIRPEIVAEGLVLGHKYLRLFHAMNSLSDKLCTTNWGSSSSDIFTMREQIKKCVWEGKEGNIRVAQLREHFLRSEIVSLCGFVGSHDNLNSLPDVVDAYDEHTEFPILLDLVDVLLDEKTTGLVNSISSSGKTKKELIRDVDEITGWA
jgi:hypothetical protein